jgi:hypothetical protein
MMNKIISEKTLDIKYQNNGGGGIWESATAIVLFILFYK